MLNKELLDSLKAAQEENNKDKFVDLCYTSNITNASDYNNFHSLDIVQSTITENNNSFIENLYDCIDDNDYKRVEHLDNLNEQGKFKNDNDSEEANELAFNLYTEYENLLDSALIWLNSEKIIKDLEDYLLTKED